MFGYGLKLSAGRAHAACSINLDFTTGTLPPHVIFSRNSSAFHFDAAGHLMSVAPDTPRFSFNPETLETEGLLLETESENIPLYSQTNTTNWIKDSSNGTLLALNALGVFPGVEVSSTGMIWGRLKTSFTVVAGQSYAVTAFYQAGTSGSARFAFSGLPGGETHFAGPIGNLSETRAQIGSITGASQVLLADGNTRMVRFIFTPNAGGTAEFGLGPQSATAGETIIFLGAQIEEGGTHSTYIDTTGQSSNRAADEIEVNGIAGIFNVVATYGDGSKENLANQTVGDGYWPSLNRSNLKGLKFCKA